jgi:hypothetical protein
MHNLTPQQITIIGAAIVFGVPLALGIVVAHFTSPGGGIFSGVLMFVLILLLAWRQLKAAARQNKKEDDSDETM